MEIIFMFCLFHEAWSIGTWENPNVHVKPTLMWDNRCKTKFENIGIYESFSQPTAHVLHRVSREDIKFFFGVDLPANNGIPTQNQDLGANEQDSVIMNVPSRPSGMGSSGYHAFALVMDKVDDPNWDIRGNALERLIHIYHMQEIFVKVNARTERWKHISDDICSCALDTEGNGVNEHLWQKWIYLRDVFNTPNYTAEYQVPELKDQSTWLFWKEWKVFHLISNMHEEEALKNAALYFHCALRKYKKCCGKKRVGNEIYTMITTGDVPTACISNCIYERIGLPGSRFCFAPGKVSVQCSEQDNVIQI